MEREGWGAAAVERARKVLLPAIATFMRSKIKRSLIAVITISQLITRIESDFKRDYKVNQQ